MTVSAPAPLSQATGTCLALENVSISYGSNEAVRGVTITVNPGAWSFRPDAKKCFCPAMKVQTVAA